VAWDIPSRAINLPSFHDMTDGQQDRVLDITRDVYNAAGKRLSRRPADLYGNSAFFSQAVGFVLEDLTEVAA